MPEMIAPANGYRRGLVSLQVYVEPALRKQIKVLAAQRGVTVADIVRAALQAEVAKTA